MFHKDARSVTRSLIFDSAAWTHIMHNQLPYVNLHHESTLCKLGPSSTIQRPDHKTQTKLSSITQDILPLHCLFLFSETYFSALIIREMTSFETQWPSCLAEQTQSTAQLAVRLSEERRVRDNREAALFCC